MWLKRHFKIIVDERFLDKLNSALNGKIPKSLVTRTILINDHSLWAPHGRFFYQNKNRSIFQYFRLIKHILQWKIEHLKILYANDLLENSFNENFVREFSLVDAQELQLDVCKIPRAMVRSVYLIYLLLFCLSRIVGKKFFRKTIISNYFNKSNSWYIQSRPWTPQVDFLPIICRYKVLRSNTLSLTTDLLKRLIHVRSTIFSNYIFIEVWGFSDGFRANERQNRVGIRNGKYSSRQRNRELGNGETCFSSPNIIITFFRWLQGIIMMRSI